MIKLFRNTRKKLAEDKKTKAYLRYAFGEIVLVVFGILIALQVNNWNTAKQKHREEISYLKNLRNDLVTQKQDLEKYMTVEKRFHTSAQKVRDNFQDGRFKDLDSVFNWTNSLVSRVTIKASNTTFVELSTSGNLNLIQNDSLKKSVIRYYQSLDRFIAITEKNNTNLIDGTFNKFIFPLTIYGGNYLDQSLLNLLNFTKFEKSDLDYSTIKPYLAKELKEPKNQLLVLNMVNLRITVSFVHLQFYKSLQADTDALIEKLNTELAKENT